MYPTKRNFDCQRILFPRRADHGRRLVGEYDVDPAADQSRSRHLGGSRQSRLVVGQILPVLKRIEADQDFPRQSNSRQLRADLCEAQACLRRAAQRTRNKRCLDAVTKLGLPRFDDQNEPNPYGIAPTARNIKDGKRQSSAVAYLGPARARRNLTIIGDAQVSSLIVNGKKAEGVRYRNDGTNMRPTRTKSFSAPACITRRKFSCSRASVRALSWSVMAFRSSIDLTASAKTIKTIRW